MLDIHTHILPQVDDGSTSMQMTHDMLKEAKKAGIDIIIATPHFRSNRINRQNVLHMYSLVQSAAIGYGIRMEIGFEVHVSMLTHMDMSTIAKWCVRGTSVLLLEFSTATRPARWDVTVCDLIQNGYKPVIVHPERYLYIQKSLDMAIELKRYGCELQVDAMSLKQNRWSRTPEGRTAEKLIRDGIANYIASDAHLPEHYLQFGKVYKRYTRLWPTSGVLHDILL